MDDMLTDYYKFDPDYQETFQMLQHYHREEELLQLIKKNNYPALYQFTIDYGLDKVFIYLYQELRIPFNFMIANVKSINKDNLLALTSLTPIKS